MAWPWIPETRCGYALIRWGSAEIYTRLGRGIATRHRTSSLLEASKSVRSSFFFDKSDGITLGGSLREYSKQVISASGYTLPCVITPHHHDHSFVAFLRTPRFAGARLIKPPSPTVASTWFSQVTAACRTLSPTERVGARLKVLRVISPVLEKTWVQLRLVSRKLHGRTGREPLRFAQQIPWRSSPAQHCPLHHTYARPKGIALVDGQGKRNEIVVFGRTSSSEKSAHT
jgi:hypothetical protein